LKGCTINRFTLFLLLGLVRLLASLPGGGRLQLGRSIGALLAIFLRRRRHIIDCNLARAFPEHDRTWRRKIIRTHFTRLGEGMLEGIWGWAGDTETPPPYTITGREHVDKALNDGCGVILSAGHFTDMEMGVYFATRHWPVHAVYRPNNNPILDETINRGRRHHVASLIDRESTRQMVRVLRQGEVLWTAADQSYHGKMSAFLPFFGTRCGTNTALPTLARLGNAVILPYFVRRDGESYEVIIHQPLPDLPSGDDAADTERLTRVLEEEIRAVPETYLWGHRRYKDLAPGEPPVY